MRLSGLRRVGFPQLYENYIVPLVNAGYIDKVENKKDRRSYLFYPVLNVKQKKLFDVTESNNFSQRKIVSIVDSTIFLDRNYLISKIQGVLKYSYDIHKITKLENHEGKEITTEELVDQYYKDPGWIGDTVSNICKRYGVSRKTYYKWNNRYKQKGIEGLLGASKRPHNIKYKKITSEVEETILDLRLTKRFGCNRIKFRLKRIIEISLSTRTIYMILKRHGLNQ
jgi:transposase